MISISMINTFCRKYDLVFMEMGRDSGQDVYWFVDFNNNKVFFSALEINSKIIH